MNEKKKKEDLRFCGVYAELVNIIGEDQVKKIYSNFKGQQISFPMHLYTSEYVAGMINDKSDSKLIRLMAQKYGYSERHLARMVKKRQED